MSSSDTRARRNARYFKEELAAVRAQALSRLRDDLSDDLMNMKVRIEATGVKRDSLAKWLHGKTFDQTYHDFGPKAKQQRSRPRIQAWLDMCEGDENLFLQLYTRALEVRFPIPGGAFEWSPQLKRHNGRLTILHRWRRSGK